MVTPPLFTSPKSKEPQIPERLPITPETKVAALLDQYSELEAILIGIAPPFKKLRNPVLWRSVARVASLQQATAVGRLPVVTVVNEFRAVVGQEPIARGEEADAASYFSSQPDWFDSDRVVATINEQEVDPT
jgi:hypothetical protein